MMPVRTTAFLLCLTFALRAQDTPPQPPATPPAPADSRDQILYSSETERFWPLTKKLIRNTALDQKEIWTSPFHMKRGEAKWWLIFGGATAALIATDKRTSRELPNTADQTSISRAFSQTGAVYTLYPIAAGFYFLGNLADSPKSREVGALGAEALTDSLIVVSILKEISRRERPDEGFGNGRFFVGGTSFPSGHAIMSWSLASVIAHEYHKTPLVPITVYGLATLVSASRFSGRKHFASDIVSGAGMGWFIGRYVYRTHVDHAIHKAPIALLRPQFVPMMDAGSRTYGLTLQWNLGQDRTAR